MGSLNPAPTSAFFRTATSPTQIVEGLRAARVISESLFEEFGSLLVVLFDEHCAAFVIQSSGVVAIRRHGHVCVPLRLLIVLLLQQRESQMGASKVGSRTADNRHLRRSNVSVSDERILPGSRGRTGWCLQCSSLWCPSFQKSSEFPLPVNSKQSC